MVSVLKSKSVIVAEKRHGRNISHTIA